MAGRSVGADLQEDDGDVVEVHGKVTFQTVCIWTPNFMSGVF
jgi:hypothetical protein